jgi:hypothetical protein
MPNTDYRMERCCSIVIDGEFQDGKKAKSRTNIALQTFLRKFHARRKEMTAPE